MSYMHPFHSKRSICYYSKNLVYILLLLLLLLLAAMTYNQVHYFRVNHLAVTRDEAILLK